MIRGSYHTFETEDSLGIDEVPENKLVYVKSFFGKPKMFILKENVTSAWSILRAVQQRKLFSESEEVRNIISDLTPMFSMPLESDLTIVHGVGSAQFDRASSATYIDKDGILQYAEIDEPRFEKNGYLNENASTNVMLQSENIASATWLKTGVTATSSTILTCTTAFSEHHIYQNLPVVTGTQYTHSVTIKRGTHKYIRLTLYLHSYVTIDTTDFSVFATSSPDFYGVEILNDDTARIYVTNTSTVTGSGLSCLFSFINTNGTSDIFDGTGQTVEILNSQFEAKSFPSSFIPTTTTSVTRARDALVVDFKDNHPDILNGDFTCSLDVDITRGGVTRTAQQIIFDGSFNEPNINRYNLLRVSSTANTYQLYRSGGGTFIYTFTEGESNKLTWSVSKGVGSTYASTVKCFVNGEHFVSSLGNVPSIYTETSHATHIGIGIKAYDKVGGIDGHIKNVKIFNKELSETACSLI